MTPIRSGMVHSAFAMSMAATMRAVRDWDLAWFTVIGNTILPDARSQCVAQARAWNADKLIFIDDDISWTVRDFANLCAAPVPACTGYYVIRKTEETDQTTITIKFKDDNRNTDARGLMEVEGAGFGFIRFDRKIFDELERDCPPLYDRALPEDVNNHYYDMFPYGLTWNEDRKAHSRCGEDINFCKRMRERGFGLYLDPTISLGHHSGAEVFRTDITKNPNT